VLLVYDPLVYGSVPFVLQCVHFLPAGFSMIALCTRSFQALARPVVVVDLRM
jgi:hypothetical protein